MLTPRLPPLRRQNGVVLLIALIMLVAMTLGGIALIRSVYTTSLIAGNMAFQQSAMQSADAGIEAAVSWLEKNTGGATLNNDSNSDGYAAARQDPGTTQNWEAFWLSLQGAGRVVTLASADAAGNNVSYTIQRLCNKPGPAGTGVGCAISPEKDAVSGNSSGAGVIQIDYSSEVYYRITVRVSGPRSTVSYVQAVVAMM